MPDTKYNIVKVLLFCVLVFIIANTIYKKYKHYEKFDEEEQQYNHDDNYFSYYAKSSGQIETIPVNNKTQDPLSGQFLDGFGGKMSIHNNIFSPSCCCSGHSKKGGHHVDMSLHGKYTQSSYMGTNINSESGCACVSTKQAKYLSTRGGNAGTSCCS